MNFLHWPWPILHFSPATAGVKNKTKHGQAGYLQKFYLRSWKQEKLIDPHSYETLDFSFINIIF